MDAGAPDILLKISNQTSETFCVFVEPVADRMELIPGGDVEVRGVHDDEIDLSLDVEQGIWIIWPEVWMDLWLPGGYLDPSNDSHDGFFASAYQKIAAWIDAHRRRAPAHDAESLTIAQDEAPAGGGTSASEKSLLRIDNDYDPERTLEVEVEGAAQDIPPGFRLTVEVIGARPVEIHLVQRDESIALRGGPGVSLRALTTTVGQRYP